MAKTLETLVLKRVGDRGQESVANALNKNRSSISRFSGNEVAWKLNEIDALLEELGLQVVERDEIFISAEEYERLLQDQVDLAGLKLRLHRERK